VSLLEELGLDDEEPDGLLFRSAEPDIELELDPGDVLPPLKTDRPDAGPIVR